MVSTIATAALVVLSVVLGSTNGDSVCLVSPRNKTLRAGICLRVSGIWYQCADFGGGVLKYQKVSVTTCEHNGKNYNLFDSFVDENVRYTCAVSPDGSRTSISSTGCLTDKGTSVKKNEAVEECPGGGFKCAKVNKHYKLQRLNSTELDSWKAANPDAGPARTDCSFSISGMRLVNHSSITEYMEYDPYNLEECIELCEKRSNCAALTFNFVGPWLTHPICLLYNNVNGTVCESGWHSWFKSADKKPSENCVATTTPSSTPMIDLYRGVALGGMQLVVQNITGYLGYHLVGKLGNWEQCIEACKTRHDCAAFTFSTDPKMTNPVCLLFDNNAYATFCKSDWNSWFKGLRSIEQQPSMLQWMKTHLNCALDERLVPGTKC